MDHPADVRENLLGDPAWIPQEVSEQELLPCERQWLWGFLLFGVLVRSTRYFLRFPLWEDECFLCVSVFKRGFRELLHPLDYHQVAPGLFLWLEKAATSVFGFNEPALRLVPFLGSIASLFLFNHLISRLVRGPACLFGVAAFAVSYPGLRYAAEAKPYGTDLFASLVLVVLLVEWLRRPRQWEWLLTLVVWCPVAIGLSYPAVFTVGAVSLILLVVIVRRRLRGAWGWWIGFNAAAAIGLASVFFLVVRHQMGAELGYMSGYWGTAFPPFNSVLAFGKWAVLTHVGALLAHPAGGEHAASILTAILVLIGLGVFLRRREPLAPLLLLVPLALHFVAAALRRYPYGGHVKFSMYVAPMIYLFFGVGAAALLSLDLRKGKTADFVRNVKIVLVVLAVFGAATMARDLLHPYKTTSDQRARAFAQWFWPSAGFDDRAVDIRDDLGREFSHGTWHDLSWSAMYLANKYIYGSEPAPTLPRPTGIAQPQPRPQVLRCVLYRDRRQDFDQPAFERWLADMKKDHPYLGRDVYPFVRMDKRERRLVTVDYVEIYKFGLTEG
jgi:Dolichyl-phosphate-mannose-protein mannosyltransferase